MKRITAVISSASSIDGTGLPVSYALRVLPYQSPHNMRSVLADMAVERGALDVAQTYIGERLMILRETQPPARSTRASAAATSNERRRAEAGMG